jgi:hypothetical protein
MSHVKSSQSVGSTETLTEVFGRANARIHPRQLISSLGLLVSLNFCSTKGAAAIKKNDGLTWDGIIHSSISTIDESPGLDTREREKGEFITPVQR